MPSTSTNHTDKPFSKILIKRVRESGGTGLDLATAKGQIEVQSQPQQSSTFTFRLPLNSAKVG